jgi:prepilin-type N-terminal cleavage/methylation domain-containing protein
MLHPRANLRRGFTFIELMMGIVVTAIVLAALSVFVFGVADGWTNAESAQSIFLSGNMAIDRIDRALREATSVACPAPTDCLFWHDDNGDGVMQLSEISLLEYDGSAAIGRYDIASTNSYAGTVLSSLPTPATLKNYGAIATPLAHNISGCQFLSVTAAAGERTSAEMILNVGQGREKTTLYTTATLRCSGGSQ